MSILPTSLFTLIAASAGWDFIVKPSPEDQPLVDRPEFPSGLVRIAVARASLSHSHAQVMSRQRLLDPGRVMGHEAVGWVMEVSPLAQQWLGSQQKHFNPGDRVVPFPFLPCDGIDHAGRVIECVACLSGRPEECQSLLALGVDVDGLLTGWCDLPPQILHLVPFESSESDISWTDLLYTEAVSQACVASSLPAVVDGRHIAVVGRGQIQELTARIIEVERFGWNFKDNATPFPTPPIVSTPDLQELDLAESSEQYEQSLEIIKVHRLDPSALPRHPRAFDVIVETWADPASLADMFHALRPGGVLIRKSRPGRAVSLLKQSSPLMPVRVVEAPYGSFSEAIKWMMAHPGALRFLGHDAHRWSHEHAEFLGEDHPVPLLSEMSQQEEGVAFPFTSEGVRSALDSDRRRDQLGKVFFEIGNPPQSSQD